MKAYETYIAYKYLVADIGISDTTITYMKRDVHREENDVCTLALLKLYSEREELNEEEQHFAEYWLARMESKGKVLPAFLQFAKYFSLPESLEDKVLIEYRTHPNRRVPLHYSSRISETRAQRQ